MIAEAHVCCVCKREIVWTDCMPAICWKCKAQETEKKNSPLPAPDIVIYKKPS